MYRHGLLLIISIFPWAGCRGPTASFDPFAPYGSRRVPPPPTGTIGQATPYEPPAAGTPLGPAGADNRTSNNTRSLLNPEGLVRNEQADSSRWRNTQSVDPASHDSTRAASGEVERELMTDLRAGENLQWTRPSLASERGSSASGQARPDTAVRVPPAALNQNSPSTVSPDRGLRSPDTPGRFAPRGELLEITQLPRYGYTPDTFNPRIGTRPASHFEPVSSNGLDNAASDRGRAQNTPTPGKTVVGSGVASIRPSTEAKSRNGQRIGSAESNSRGLKWRPRTTR